MLWKHFTGHSWTLPLIEERAAEQCAAKKKKEEPKGSSLIG